MSSTSGFTGLYLGTPHAGGGIGGIDSPGASGSIQDLSPMDVISDRVNGFALQNGTPTILAASPACPNDGANHLVMVIVTANVATTETGGAVTVLITDGPTGRTSSTVVQPGGSAAGIIQGTNIMQVVGPGSTVTITQSSALTGGTATVSARVLYV